ncbi:MAG: hypothetical protein KDE27_15965 [Planctomycetes bacterium]|nr:hypothetical protein [Planctomycetota bacterium]
MLRPTLLALLAPAVPLAAQTPPCLAANDATSVASGAITSYGFAGENSFAWQVTPAAGLVVQAARVFTANTTLTGDRFMALELRDDQGGAPGARLGGGAWQISNARPAAWQGCNLDQLVVLQPNVPVWLVWIEPGFSQPMTEPGGLTTLPYQTRSGTGSWTAQTPNAPKFRLYCSQLDDVGSVPHGLGCPLSTGWFPTAFTNEAPQLGNTDFFFETSGNPAGAAVFAVLGWDPNFTSTAVTGLPPSCLQHTDALAAVLLAAGTGNTRGPTFAGHAALAFPIPNDPSLSGVFFAMQAAAFDAGAASPLPFGTSNAHRITLY